jgi:hypothetical protein
MTKPQNRPPHALLAWLSDQEAAGQLEALTAVAVLKDGSVRYIALGSAKPIEADSLERIGPCETANDSCR